MFDFARIIGFALATYPLVFIIFFPALWFAHRQLGKPFGRKRITFGRHASGFIHCDAGCQDPCVVQGLRVVAVTGLSDGQAGFIRDHH